MGEIIPFDQATKSDLAALQSAFAPDTSLVVSGGFPSLSIKGSKFAISRGGEREVIKNPQTGDIASSIEVCVVAYSPNVAKTYYEGRYEEGSADAPDCYSNDGKHPASDAESPQSKSCAACPHNKWGSAINESTGKKSKKCADVRRLAVSNPGQINEPMLLRIPPTSMKNLGEYQKMLANRNMGIQAVVTKLNFDEDASSPLLHFTPIGLCDADMLQEILDIQGEDIVKQITGELEVEYVDEDDVPEEDIAPPVEEKPPAKKKAAAKKAPAKKAAAKKPEPEPEPEPVVESTSADDDLFAALDGALDL